MAAPASAPASASASLPWDHLLAGARQAGIEAMMAEEAGHRLRDAFVGAFHVHISQVLSRLTRADHVLIGVDARLELSLHQFAADGNARALYAHLVYDTPSHYYDPIDLDLDLQPTLAHQLRRVHRLHPAAWAALRAWTNYRTRPLDEDGEDGAEADDADIDMVARLDAFAALMQDVGGTAAAGPASAAAGVKRDREVGAGSESISYTIAPWDRTLAEARRVADQHARAANDAAVEGGWDVRDDSLSAFIRAFKAVIHAAHPGADRVLVARDAQVAWELREFNEHGEIDPLYMRLVRRMNRASDALRFRRPGIDTTPHLHFQIRRIYQQNKAAWAAIMDWVTDGVNEHSMLDSLGGYPRRISSAKRDANAFRVFAQAAVQPDVERTRFDASQIERHMAMAHRVPADVSNLIGQFATTGITAQTSIPLRLQTKHKLELLTRRVATLTATQAAAELRDILGEVEEALPEDERVIKKARK